MTKLLCSAVLFAGVAGLVTSTAIPTAPAQDKKDTAKKAPAGKAGIVEVNEGKDGKFRFTVRDADGKFLAQSGAFEKKEDAMKGIETLKDVLPKATVTSGPAPKKTDK